MDSRSKAILCVANWDSNVGYAWWLMESFWIKIAEHYHDKFDVVLAYPSISTTPPAIEQSSLKVVKSDFTFKTVGNLIAQLRFILKNNIKYIYLTDRPNIHWRYFLYRLVGVKKIIVHDHTPGIRTKPKNIKRILKKLIYRLPVFTTDCSIGATEFVKQRLVEVNCIPEKRCFSAPNGLANVSQNSDTIFDLSKAFNIPTNSRVIVSVGRANLYKGVDFALQTIEALIYKLNCQRIHFLYLGDGPHLNRIQQLAIKLNINNYVTSPGRVKEIAKILPACDIAFHPSKGEVGYSLSILEYMQAGLPVVVSNNLSVCEATTNEVDGLIYQQGNIMSAATSLKSLLDDSERAKIMGESAARKVKEKYSLDKCHQALIKAIENTIGIKSI